MKKFLEFLRVKNCRYEIRDGAVIVLDCFTSQKLDLEHISIPENTDFSGGLDLGNSEGEVHLPENMRVALILYLRGAGVKRLPSNLTIDDDCSVYLDAHKIKNVSYRENCGRYDRTIFAFWANDDFLIAAGCFAGTYSEFEERVNDAYYDYKGEAAEYKRQAQNCISELAEKLGKPDPFKKSTAK